MFLLEAFLEIIIKLILVCVGYYLWKKFEFNDRPILKRLILVFVSLIFDAMGVVMIIATYFCKWIAPLAAMFIGLGLHLLYVGIFGSDGDVQKNLEDIANAV